MQKYSYLTLTLLAHSSLSIRSRLSPSKSFTVPFALLIIKTKNNPIERAIFMYLENNYLAGDESSAGNPSLADFTLAGLKLEQLGFTYDKGSVVIVYPSELQ
jgi:hypothetical protein